MVKTRGGKRDEGKRRIIKRINKFELFAPEAKNVFLVGDFNNWDIHLHPMKNDSEGMWKISIDLMPGVYEYRYLVDGKWKSDLNYIIAL